MKRTGRPGQAAALAAAMTMIATAGCLEPTAGPGVEGLFGDLHNGGGDGGSSSAATGDAATATGSGGAAGSADGLPCEVAELLGAHCTSCHAAGTLGTEPLLETYADLVAPSVKDASKSNAEWSLETMKGQGKPMPPGALLGADALAPLSDWIAAGMPAGECNGGSGGGGAGGQGSGPSPYDAPEQCTSNAYWMNGIMGSKQMTPGQACVHCHTTLDQGPLYQVAGTVFPTAHEPDDCFGALDAEVEIVDANGQVLLLKSEDGGNFFYKPSSTKPPIVFPVKTRVLWGGQALEMIAEVNESDGDCNTCHTQDGADGAPGRIILPF